MHKSAPGYETCCCIMMTIWSYLVHQLLVICWRWWSHCLALGCLFGSVSTVWLDLRVIRGVVCRDRLHWLHPLHPESPSLHRLLYDSVEGSGGNKKAGKPRTLASADSSSHSPQLAFFSPLFSDSPRCLTGSSFTVNHSLWASAYITPHDGMSWFTHITLHEWSEDGPRRIEWLSLFFCCGGFSFKSSDIRSIKFDIIYFTQCFGSLCIFPKQWYYTMILKNGDECMFRLIIVVLVEITMRQDKITNVSFGKFC